MLSMSLFLRPAVHASFCAFHHTTIVGSFLLEFCFTPLLLHLNLSIVMSHLSSVVPCPYVFSVFFMVDPQPKQASTCLSSCPPRGFSLCNSQLVAWNRLNCTCTDAQQCPSKKKKERRRSARGTPTHSPHTQQAPHQHWKLYSLRPRQFFHP